MKVDVSFFDANPVRLASRASQLAMVQAEMVCTALQPAAVTVRPVTSEGDRILDRSLVEAGGKGLFINCLLYTSPSPRDQRGSRMPSSA